MTEGVTIGNAANGRAPVFISFASEDLEAATRLRTGLEAGGLRCWIAPRDIEAGSSFPAAITAAIKSCCAVILLLTESSNDSPHVLSEVELAFNARKPILAVRISSAFPSPNLQYFISTTHWFDSGTEFDDEDVARLRTRLEQLLAGKRIGEDSQRTHRRWRAVAAVLIPAALLTASYFTWFRTSPSRDVETSRTLNPAGGLAQPVAPVSPNLSGPAADGPRVRTKLRTLNGQNYVWIPPGRFSMGCSHGDSGCESDEYPTHVVRVEKGFWLGQTEVTLAQYSARRAAPSQAANGTSADTPVIGVTWKEAKAYCGAVGGRLPTEAEWEYAARAGTTERYYDTATSIAWYADNSDEHPHPVGRKAPNSFGLYDMLGNVYELVLDRYYIAYDDSSDGAVEEPLLPNASAVARGGAWTSGLRDIRVSNRLALFPDEAEPIVGLRCAVSEE